MLTTLKRKLLFIASLIVVACHDNPVDPWNAFQPFSTSYDTYHLSYADKFAREGKSVGEVPNLLEGSGITQSISNPNSLWTHADSGNPPIIYLLDQYSASIKASYYINGIENDDWEDIACGPGPKPGTNYIYVGDIGDNDAKKTERVVYRFPEPFFAKAHEGRVINVSPEVEKLRFKYPDGSHNAETLLLDPLTRDVYIITKYGSNSLIFVNRHPQSTTEVSTVSYVGQFPFREATGGAISISGSKIAVKTYDQIFYWQRNSSEPLWKVFGAAPQLLYLYYNPQEPKGEAICLDDDGYFTLSESRQQSIPTLYYYPKK